MSNQKGPWQPPEFPAPYYRYCTRDMDKHNRHDGRSWVYFAKHREPGNFVPDSSVPASIKTRLIAAMLLEGQGRFYDLSVAVLQTQVVADRAVIFLDI